MAFTNEPRVGAKRPGRPFPMKHAGVSCGSSAARRLVPNNPQSPVPQGVSIDTGPPA